MVVVGFDGGSSGAGRQNITVQIKQWNDVKSWCRCRPVNSIHRFFFLKKIIVH
jgi:hypothetical protein